LAREAESFAPEESMRVARLTVELMRPVDLGPISLEARLIRPGRKVQIVEVISRQDGIEVATARALRIRTAHVDLPESARAEQPPFALPETCVAIEASGTQRAFHTQGAELRFVKGAFESPGPAIVWVRLKVPVVLGEMPSPLERVAAAADFGNGVSSPLSFEDWMFINPDLTVHLSRPPAGEWVGLDSHTVAAAQGIGIAESSLWDEKGPIGRAVQSLLIDRLKID
jgi:acyl-CoA thioesterase